MSDSLLLIALKLHLAGLKYFLDKASIYFFFLKKSRGTMWKNSRRYSIELYHLQCSDCVITTEAVRMVAKCSRLRLGRGVCAG